MAMQSTKHDTDRGRAKPGRAGTGVRRSKGRTRPGAAKRMPADQRKATIVDAALGLFARLGFSGTTTKAIARAAGISEATMFQHFATKEELYLAAFEQKAGAGIQEFVARLQGYADRNEDEALVAAIVHAVLDGYSRHRDMQRMLLFAWLDQERVANTHMWAQMRNYPLFDFLRSYIARRQAEGVFRPGDPDLLSQMLIAVPVHYATRTRLYGIKSPHADETVARTFVRLFLDGARTTPVPDDVRRDEDVGNAAVGDSSRVTER